jgi:HlyD family secretion protein
VKKASLILLSVGVIGGAGFAYYKYEKKPPAPTITTAAVTRGDVVDTVGATGTLQAVKTVQVGTQVSGTIQALYADFNSLVKKGQVLARLDPSLFQTQIEQARANLIRAQADLERLKVGLDDARTKLARAQELSSRQLIPASDLETAQVNVRSIEAQIRSSEAQVTQAQASLNQNDVNLQHTVITAPIDGLVISRNVDVGQTVAASMQAPTLFVLAADLTQMQVVANLDESDVGRIRPGQHVSFRVDAYPADAFDGSVSQVRLQPIVQQNVVTYATVIDVPNPALKLKPGMTANVNIEINKRTNVVRVPNAALRFRPTNEVFAALGLTPPDPAELRAFGAGQGPGGGRGRGPSDRQAAVSTAGTPEASSASSPGTAAPRSQASPVASPPANPQRAGRGAAPRPGAAGGDAADDSASTDGSRRDGSGGRGGGGGRGGFGGRGRGGGGFAERLQGLSPEERERALEQLRARGGRSGAAPTDAPVARRNPSPPAAADPPAATTFDALFAPLPPVETAGRVWLHQDKELKPLRLRIGVSDGQNSELLEGDLEEGTELVTNVIVATQARPAATGGFPGLGQPQRGGFPGGFQGGGGGGNRGGGGGRGR